MPTMASSACPLCLSEIGKAASFKCPGCGSKYHKDCAADSGECIVVGCSAAAKSKTGSTTSAQKKTTGAGATSRTSGTQKSVSRAILVIAVAASLLIGAGIGYSTGDTAGFDRGYSAGYGSGETAGYESGQTAGYSVGYEDGKSSGYFSGYSAGFDSACRIYSSWWVTC
jgi:hypothetical protein